MSYRQPLVRGFNIDALRQQVEVSLKNRDISSLQLQQTLATTLRAVRNAYWNLAYATALRHYLTNGLNRVVLLTDGAANLGDVSAASLKGKVETWRKRGVALDCFGIGWEGLNDELLEALARNGDGRYGFVNTPEEASTGFAAQLAGALNVAAADVKVQVEFNPARVTSWRQIGYAKHQLTKEGRLLRTYGAAPGKEPKASVNAYLEDYSSLAHGLLVLNKATNDKKWLDAARKLVKELVRHKVKNVLCCSGHAFD